MAAELVNSTGSERVISGMKPLLLLIGVAAAIAAGVGVMLWSVGPTYSLLYSNLAAEDTAQITQSLEGAGIPYKLENGVGAISVPAEQLAAARLRLASQGLPESGGGVNAMTRDPGFGVSAFMENARYQHALETELARTIASLQNVQGARVHLAMARQSAFVSERRPGSASVFLQIKAGRRLDDENVQAIANLVASSIPELTASQVTVVDQSGRLLSAPETDSDTAMRDKMFEFSHRLEESYSNRIQEMLTPLVGPGRVRAQVVAQVDMTTTESTREQFNPQSQVVRSESTAEEAARNGAGNAGGVPGALTNQPPTPGVALAPGQTPAVAQSGAKAPPRARSLDNAATNADGTAVTGPDSTSRQTTRNYEIDRTMAYTRAPAGRVTRLSVAVLIDNLRTTDKDGKVTETPLPADQLDRLTALVRDAVGFDSYARRHRQRRELLVPRYAGGRRGRARVDSLLGARLGADSREGARRAARIAGHRVQRAQAADQGIADRRAPVGAAAGGAGRHGWRSASGSARARLRTTSGRGARHGRAGSEARSAGRESLGGERCLK